MEAISEQNDNMREHFEDMRKAVEELKNAFITNSPNNYKSSLDFQLELKEVMRLSKYAVDRFVNGYDDDEF